MSNIFTTNPIKLNIISRNNKIKQTIIFIGIVPDDVKSAIKKIRKTLSKKEITILKKFYGSLWWSKLNYNKNKTGGDEFSFDDDIISDIANDVSTTESQSAKDDEAEQVKDVEQDGDIEDVKDGDKAEQDGDVDDVKDVDDVDDGNKAEQVEQQTQIEQVEQVEKLKTNKKSTDEPDVSEYIDSVDLSDNITLDDLIIDSSEETRHQETNLKNLDSRIVYLFDEPFLSVYPEDKIIEFKKKIYAILNIPIFRQHIWYVYQGRVYPVNYSIFQNQSLITINVQHMLKMYNAEKMQTIETIPVNQKYYDAKDMLKIEAYDTFSIMSDYYYKYGITEYNLLDLNEFIEPSRAAINNVIKEKFQLDLIYYSFIMIYWPMLSLAAFTEYIKSEKELLKSYPDLIESTGYLKKKFAKEKEIIDNKYNLVNTQKKYTKVKQSVSNSIVYAIISVLSYQNSKNSVLHIRNLFDKLPLTSSIISCKCRIIHNNKEIILSKVYKNAQHIRKELDINSILYKIRIDNTTTKTINLTFYQNGNYVIHSSWREEKRYDFNDIFYFVKKLVDPIIYKINKFQEYTNINHKILYEMTKENSKFTEIGMSMFYKKAITIDMFGLLKKILNDYTTAGIMTDRLNEINTAEYYFSKGMYQFKASRIERVATLKNYYDFLTDGIIKQKWYTIFEKTRITKFHHRLSDVKIEIIGIKENEFFIFYNFIMSIFHTFEQQLSSKTFKKDVERHSNLLKHSLKNLRNQDPVLYDFKKLYKTDIVYSKICQKPYQPMLLNKQAYNELPPDKKKNAVKYWNFTTNKDAYYSCPNPKLPYIKFIIKRHPKDYCIPCCKKTKINEDTKDAKKLIYETCIKTHKYAKEERTITLGSKYVMSYGKDIEPGRLSRLPEDSLEPMFYETYSVKTQGIDSECITTNGYYLYGVEQSINGVNNVGILNILIHATETILSDFISNVIKLVKMTPNKFRILLNGDINKYFNNIGHFIDTINNVFMENTVVETNFPWNDIFINIAYLYLNLNIVHFTHPKKSNIILNVPSYITNKDQFLSSEFHNIVVLKKQKKYYPIYFLNLDVFFKVKMFTEKIFKYNDPVMKIISKLINKHFSEQIKKKLVTTINLTTITTFTNDTKYKIVKLFVNKSNMCYYVHLLKDKINVYVPIDLSYHLESKNREITYEMFTRKKYVMSVNDMNKFIVDFNQWVAIVSRDAGMIIKDASTKLPLEKRVQPIYPYIKQQAWLVLSPPNKKIKLDSTVIGFTSQNINYYIKDIKLSHALKIKNAKIIPIFYDPDVINKHIFNKTNAIVDKRCKTIGMSIYNNYLYRLVLLEFMTTMNKQRNVQLRKQIKKKLLGDVNKGFNDIMKDIEKLINDCDDYNTLKNQVCEFMTMHHKKSILFTDIDNTFYNFDRKKFIELKKLPKKKLINELKQLSKSFIKFGEINAKTMSFPNMFISCQTKQKKGPYCMNNKLIINKKKFENIIEILASDILNPVKEKWLFSDVMGDNTVSYYKFIRRPDETITITLRN